MASGKTETRELQGTGASPGIAIGPVRIADRSRVAVYETGIMPEDVPAEIFRFRTALVAAEAELKRVKQEVESNRGPEHLYVIDAHLLILQDSMLLRKQLKRLKKI